MSHMRNQCSNLVHFVHSFYNMSNMDFCCSPQTRPTMISTSPKPQTPIQCRFPYQSYDQSGSPKTSLLSPSIISHNNVSYPYCMPESRFAYQAYADFNDIPIAAPPVLKARLGGEVKEDDEEVEEIIRGILELFERLPSSLKDKVALEIMNKEMSKQNGLHIGSTSTTTSTRGIGGPVEDSCVKLERFKVKTFVVGDVTKDDQQK